MGLAGGRLFVFLVVFSMTGIGGRVVLADEYQPNDFIPIALQKVGCQWELNNALTSNAWENCNLRSREQTPSVEDDQNIWLRGTGAISVLPLESNNMF